MKRLQRMTWGVHFLAPCLLALPSCIGASDWVSSDGRVEVTTVESNCMDWNAYDAYWHRCHWGERGINWCNAPPGYTETVDAGSTGTGLPGSGSGAAADGGETSSPDGATASGSSGASGGSGSTSSGTGAGVGGAGGSSGSSGWSGSSGSVGSGGAGGSGGVGGSGGAGASGTTSGGGSGQAIACTTGATCPAGDACVTGSCQPCAGGVCECQRDDDCAANQICDHTVGTCTQPPPACTALTTEAACVARADCTPIYGGMSCTNSAGNACQSGEANCTCATYAFAACIARSP